jgi:hypothetical protein
MGQNALTIWHISLTTLRFNLMWRQGKLKNNNISKQNTKNLHTKF